MAHTQHTPELGTWTQNQSFLGLEIGARMTVIRLDNQGSLLVHSPIALTPLIQSELEAMGQVAYVVAPNKWHHLYVGNFKKAYPQAQFFCAPGLDKKRADFQFDGVLSDKQNFPWNPTVEHLLVQGAPMFNEVVFFHRESRTLIMTDTALHICESASLKTKIMFTLLGTFGKFGLSLPEKWLFIKDKPLFNSSMEKISHWDFDRIIVAHGQTIETAGKVKFCKAYVND